ncbi:hypothetical protein ACVWVZ_000142 [Pseudomonas tolaasii]
MNKSNRHKKTPTLAGDGVLVNEINFEEEIVMNDISTAVAKSNVVPFRSATRAAMVLSDLLQRADKRAGELAVAYDRARIAGLACERAYNSLESTGSRAR